MLTAMVEYGISNQCTLEEVERIASDVSPGVVEASPVILPVQVSHAEYIRLA